MAVRKWSLILTGPNTGCIAKLDDPWAHSPHHLERVSIMEIPAGGPEHAQESQESMHVEPGWLGVADSVELENHRQMVRILDTLLNGLGGGKASLSDLVAQVEREGIKSRNFIPEQVALF